jgi:hypothetical protein
MVFFTPKALRIEGECRVDIRLQEYGHKTYLPGVATGVIVNLSKKGACLMLQQMLLEGRHLFFSTLNTESCQLVLFFNLAPESKSPIIVSGRSVWMDYHSAEDKSAFKVGIEFHENQNHLLKIFRKNSRK